MAEPAPPILGSTLFATALSILKPRPAPASASCHTLNEALDGGFRYGEIISIAGPNGIGKSLIALHAIASHLIAYENGETAFIDTTGSFSPLRLRDVIVTRLRQLSSQTSYNQSGYVYEKVPAKAEAETLETLRGKATVMLDRVSVMRVFDFPGVVEAINEISEICEMNRRSLSSPIADDEDASEETSNQLLTGQVERDKQGDGDHESGLDPPRLAPGGAFGMIVIDNIATVVDSMMSKNHISGQAFLATSLRSLHILSAAHSICTILINSAVAINNPTDSAHVVHVSSFASTNGKPALGRIYAFLIDSSIFLSRVPKDRRDSEIAYGGERNSGRKWASVGILEVLKDRNGDREGAWGAFEMGEGGELRSFE